MKKDKDEIPKHPRHDRITMVWFFFAAFSGVGFWHLGDKNTNLQTFSIVGYICSVVAMFAIPLTRSVLAWCPDCKKRMKWVGSQNDDGNQIEVQQCPECKKKWRITGISTD